MVYSLMSSGELAHSIGARLVSNSRESNNNFYSVSIDSRNIEKDSLFFALCGKQTDGHKFVKSAFEKGSCAAVVSKDKIESFNLLEIAKELNKDLIIVDDTLKGLQDSARVYLEKFPKLKKVGITGSSGKTTTKEITASIISSEYKTVMNKGNLNSETGLPLSVFEVRGEHEVGIFELGMNRAREISEIAYVLKPNIALITNIGTAHIEYFGTKEKILNEKKSIFNFLNKDDIALIPSSDEYKEKLAEGVKAHVRYYGENSFSELEGVKNLGLDGTEITWAGKKINFALPGVHCLHDAMAAIAIAKEIPVSNDAIKKGLESVKPLFGRQEILKGKTTVIRDCYNANPESTAMSIDFCNDIDWKEGRKIFVIGDMLELGDASKEAHVQIGKQLVNSKADMIYLFGGEIVSAIEELSKSNKKYFYTDNMETLLFEIKMFIKDGDFVLLKGSRGCALERLTDVLIGGNV